MKKKWLLSMLTVVLVVAFLLAGCTAGQANEPAVSGKTVLKTALSEYTDKEILARVALYCDYYGVEEDALKEDTQIWNRLIEGIVNDYAFVDMAAAMAEESGIPVPDAQSEEVETVFGQLLTEIDGVIQKNAQEPLEGEALLKAEDEYMAGLGFTREEYRGFAQRKVTSALLQREWGKDIEITEEELQSEYQANLDAQKQYMDIDPVYAVNFIKKGEQAVVYYPQGLKYIKSITVPLDAETRGKAAILYNEGKMRDYNILLEEAVAALEPEIEEIRAKLQSGTPFEELMGEYGADGQEGQLVSEADTKMITDFQKAVKELQNVGDVAECDTYEGHHFIQYSAEVKPGAVPLDEVSEALKQGILQKKAIASYEQKMLQALNTAKEAGTVVLDFDSLMLEEAENA
ncbi:MAG: hypothetical protein VB081_14295 [Christensenella sp.]|uniref:hypothetical protein n=1 Tax=Christensenella sp. TaxID=1935934 RepID=UPI002B20D493|nr:hypothetical protein [Christensenella sp.]MEA5004654.1 hypothetical protein [Christensenella sp.]